MTTRRTVQPEHECYLCGAPIPVEPGRGVDCGEKNGRLLYAHLRCFLENDRKQGGTGRAKVEALRPAYPSKAAEIAKRAAEGRASADALRRAAAQPAERIVESRGDTQGPSLRPRARRHRSGRLRGRLGVAAGLRDVVHERAGLAVARGARDVGLGEDAHEPVALDDREPPNLVLRHQAEQPGEGVTESKMVLPPHPFRHATCSMRRSRASRARSRQKALSPKGRGRSGSDRRTSHLQRMLV